MKTAIHMHGKFLLIKCPYCGVGWTIAYSDAQKQYQYAGPEWRCDECMKLFRVKRRWFNARKTPRTTGDG
jgi:NAD-dependent SIR2 family protein deacetylase